MDSNYKLVYKINDNLLQQMLELDASVYKEEDSGVLEICKEWISVNDDIYTMLLHNNKVIGYINFMPITNECYLGFVNGTKKDYEITSKDIVKFSKTEENKCLLTSVVLHEDYQNGEAIKYLCDGFIQKLKDYKKENIIISTIILDCVSEDGEKFAKYFLNAKLVKDLKTSKIYEGNLTI
ncbi:MAG: hypothetical protein IJZ26_02205 [Clostridia bacterium]|nr:hypothetical protein [Clostridia bacterium]